MTIGQQEAIEIQRMEAISEVNSGFGEVSNRFGAVNPLDDPIITAIISDDANQQANFIG